MIEIPLYIFLFLYFIFLSLFVGFYLFILYHIVMTASFTLASFMMSFFVFASTVLVLYATTELLAETDWQAVAFSFDLRGIMAVFGVG